MDTKTSTPTPKCLFNIIKMTEELTRLRYCNGCDSLLQTSSFQSDRPGKRFRCYECFKAGKRAFLSTQLQRAFNSLLCRARYDREAFGHETIALSTTELLETLTMDQIQNFSVWSLVPENPNLLLSKDNVVVIRSFQRKFLVTQWKRGKDLDLYARNLREILATAPGIKTKDAKTP